MIAVGNPADSACILFLECPLNAHLFTSRFRRSLVTLFTQGTAGFAPVALSGDASKIETRAASITFGNINFPTVGFGNFADDC